MQRRGLALVAMIALAACATSEPEVPALVEIETVAPPTAGGYRGIHLVTVARDGSVERRSHHWDDSATRPQPQTLPPDQLDALRDLLATPVLAEQSNAPIDANEFRITAHGSPEWSVECYEHEVYRCPIPFVKLWQSLDETIGDLPQR